MSYADSGNAIFEMLGAIFIVRSIRKLCADRMVRGIAWEQVAFWAAWGWWNIYYYWAVGSPLSWWAGLAVTAANSTYTGMLIYYTWKEKQA